MNKSSNRTRKWLAPFLAVVGLAVTCLSCSKVREHDDQLLLAAANYRTYKDLFSLRAFLDLLPPDGIEQRAIVDLIGTGVALLPSELKTLLADRDDGKYFPDGIQATDEFRGYVLEDYPNSMVIALQFRGKKFIHVPRQLHYLFGRASAIDINGKPWCFYALNMPGGFRGMSWRLFVGTNMTGVVRSNDRAYPVALNALDWGVLTNLILSVDFTALKGGERGPLGGFPDDALGELVLYANGETHSVDVFQGNLSENERKNLSEAWAIVKSTVARVLTVDGSHEANKGTGN